MKLVVFDGDHVGVVEEDQVFDISQVVPRGPAWPPTFMNSLIHRWSELATQVDAARRAGDGIPLDAVRLEAPVPMPGHIVGAPANYRRHIEEMGARGSGRDMRELGFFLMAPSSVTGPGTRVVLPRDSVRDFHHECELAVVIGQRTKDVAVEDALSHVFGYSCLMDLTMRMTETLREERTMRKSFDTFTPMGPWILTADEVPDPQRLHLELFVNDERRQCASTGDMIVPVAEQIALVSSVMTLRPGDVIATGTPDGVGPIRPGDSVRIAISGIGGFAVDVVQADTCAPVRF